jgi:glycosyltransferase involved in cell wall biosynthesis
VLSLQTDDGLGGTELMTFSMLTRLDRGRFDVTVCFLAKPGPVGDMYRRQGIEVHHLRHDGQSTRQAMLQLWRLLRTGHFDIIEIYGLRLNVAGRVLGGLSGHRRIIAAQRSVDDWRRWWHVWLDRVTSRWVALYVANSQAAADRLASREHILSARITVIENGIDPSPYAQSETGRVRAELAVSPDAVVLTCVANYREAKGHHVLIDAVARLVAVHPEVRLWLVGGDTEPADTLSEYSRASIEDHVERAGLGQHVDFLGIRQDIPAILADSDVFVLSSLWEGMPGSILEAMAARLPVVASRVGGIPEVVVESETGYLVPPNDPVSLADALRVLVEDRARRTAMGQNAFDRVSRSFSIDEKVRELQAVYLSLAGPERGAGGASRR